MFFYRELCTESASTSNYGIHRWICPKSCVFAEFVLLHKLTSEGHKFISWFLRVRFLGVDYVHASNSELLM